MDKVKLSRQLTSVQKWRNNKGLGTVVLPTGMGKSLVGGLVVAKAIKHNKLTTILVTYSNSGLDKNWRQAIETACKIEGLDLGTSLYAETSVSFLTADKIIANKQKLDYDILIVDEIDAFYSDERFKIIDGTYVKYKHILGLTATFEDKSNRHLKLNKYAPIVDEVTEKEAIENGWISQYLEFNIGVELTETNREIYDKLTNTINEYLPRFDKNLQLANNCLYGGKDKKDVLYPSDDWCRLVAEKNGWKINLDINSEEGRTINSIWNPNMIKGYAKHLMVAIRERTQLLYKSEEKLEIAFEVFKKFNDLKAISFSQSTDFANHLADKINMWYKEELSKDEKQTDLFNLDTVQYCVVYHSNLETKMMPSPTTGKLIKFGAKRLKDLAIENIKKGKAKVISTVSSLDKGFDVTDLRLAVISSRTSNPTQRTQRNGRPKRIDELAKDSVSLIVNIYLKYTQDELWLKTSQEDADNTIYWVKSVDDISYTPKKRPLILLD